MRYKITYEWPAGSVGSDDAKPHIDGIETESLAFAINEVLREVDLQSFNGDSDLVFDTQDNELVFFEENREGCGHFIITTIE